MPTEPHFVVRFLRWTERYTKTDMVYLAHGGFWLILGQILTIFISLGVAISFAHLASPDAYGNYKYVLSISSLLLTFSLSGIGSAVMQSAARGFEGSLRQGLYASLRWSGASIFLSILTAAYYYFVDHNVFLGISFLIVAVLSPVLTGFSLFDPFLLGKKDFRRNTLYTFFNTLFPALALILALFFSNRAIIFVAVYFATNAIADIFFYLLAKRGSSNDMADPNLLSYAKHLSVMGIINAIADKIDTIIVFGLLGPTQLAIYAYAIAMPEQIKAILKLTLPLSIGRFADRSITQIRTNIWARVSAFTLVSTAAVLLYALMAPYIFKIFFPIYTDAIYYSQIYAFSIIFTAIIFPLASIFQAHKKTRALYVTSNVRSIALIIILPLCVYFYGIAGAIGAQFIYRLINMSLSLWEFSRIKDI